jgi:actin-related protein
MEARESLTKLLLGTFNVRGLNLTTSAQMILKGRGQSSGLVIEIHENSLCIVPVIEELVLQHAIVTMPSLSERRIIERVRKLLLLSHETIGTYEKLGKNLQLQIAKDMLVSIFYISSYHIYCMFII